MLKKAFLLLTILFTSHSLIAQITADQPAGSGTLLDPYVITTFNNLFWISDNSETLAVRQFRNQAHYIQANDIDASPSQSLPTGFNPIGKFLEGGFTGSYDGQGFQIDGLFINRNAFITGFFGDINGGQVQNLNFTNASVSSNSNDLSVLSGRASNSATIENCSVTSSSVTSTGSVGNISAFIGTLDNSNITDSYVAASTITASNSDRVGGLAGRVTNNASITTSYVFDTTITGDDDVGGFVGTITSGISGSGTISNSYARASVKTENGTAAGFVGDIGVGTIDDCYTTSDLEILNSGSGIIYAFADQTGTNLINNSFFNNEIFNIDNSDATGETTANLKTESTFINVGWDFVCETNNGTDFIWNINTSNNDGYPNLDSDQIIPLAIQPSGSGTSLDPYLISSLENLLWITENPTSWTAFFEQTANIDASTTEFWGCDGVDAGWIVIANDVSETFSGNYDGAGFSIDNLYINSNQTNVGLFGNLSGNVSNLSINNASITASSTLGALAGTLQANADVNSIYINSGTITSTVTGASTVGGAIGEVEGGLMTTSFSTITVNGDQNVGGFVGLVTGGQIDNSFARGDVVGVSSVGGFAGSISNGLIDKSYAANSVTASDVNEDPAGFSNQSGVTLVTNSFYDASITSTDDSDATGETTANMNLAVTFINQSWDFVCETTNGSNDIWRIVSTENDSYPIFESTFTLPDLSPQGDGTSANPYLIANLGNLIWLANNSTEWDKFYLQTANIDLSGTIDFECDDNNSFKIIAQGALESFTGNYDGQNFTLSNLNLDFDDDRIAFFGTLNNATVSNLNFTFASISGDSNVGVLAGLVENNSTIENCSIDGTITQNNAISVVNTGGLAGNVQNSTISNITLGSSSLSIISFGDYAGGLVGRASGSTISNINLSGSVSSNGNYTGGLAGESNGSNLSLITSSVAVSGGSFLGGIAGEMNNSSVLTNTTSSGNITVNLASTQIGGLIGYCLNSDLTTNSNYTGSITASTSNEVGGLVGNLENSTLSSLGTVSPTAITANNQVGGLVGLSLNSTIDNINIEFNSINADDQVGGAVGLFDQSTITGVNVQLNALQNNQINGNDQVGGVLGRVQGDVSGNGVTINTVSNEVTVVGNQLLGSLIGDIDANITLQNITLNDVNIQGSSKIGGLIGQTSSDVTLNQVGIDGLTITGTVGSEIGGLIGVSNGDISNSYIKNFSIDYSTSLTNCGGFVGEISSGILSDVYVLSTSSLVNSFSNTSVTNTAGFVGNAIGGTISRAYAAVNSNLNGFTGTSTGTTFNNNFYDEELAGGNSDTTATAETTANMNLEATFTAASWDFECETDNGSSFIWGINTTDNEAYPFLRWEGFESDCVFDISWTGNTSSDWATTSNWSNNAIPPANSDISIPVSAPNYPILDQDRSIQNLFIESGATLSIGENLLTLNGNIIGQGDIVGGMQSSITFGGQGEVGLKMDQSSSEVSNMLFNLTLEGGETNNRLVILENPVFVNNVLSLTTSTTTLQSDLNLTLYCDFNSSNLKVAQVDQQEGDITGGLIAEQCFPARRAFRFITPSLNMMGTIQENWQEGATSYNDGSVPSGYGTHITGNGFESLTPTQNSENNGLDWNPSGNPSMFSFSDVTQTWTADTRTNISLSPPFSKRLMIRGDRTINIQENAATPTNTKIRTKGTPDARPNISFVLNDYQDGDLIMSGNPYWSQIDITSVINNNSNLKNYFYYWDPNLGGEPTVGEPGGRGAWVAYLTGTFGEAPNQEPAGTVFEYDLNGVSSLSTSDVSSILQPMQAIMFVASGGPLTLNYSQSDKAISEQQVQIFSDNNENKKQISIRLYEESNETSVIDANNILFIEEANNDIGAGDIPKLNNLDENLATLVNGELLTVQLRDYPTENEELNIFLNNYRHTNYRFSIANDSFEGVDAYLIDLYTNEEVLLNQDNNFYSFSVDPNISASVAYNRFKIEFRESTLSTPEIQDNLISLYPNPIEDRFNLILPTESNHYTFSIFNLLGGHVSKENYIAEQNSNRISISNFNQPSGVYFVKVKDGDETLSTLKFIKN